MSGIAVMRYYSLVLYGKCLVHRISGIELCILVQLFIATILLAPLHKNRITLIPEGDKYKVSP
jgi:uncharacterized membrane protein (DUF4010 family)